MADEASTNPTLEVTTLDNADADAAADDAEAEEILAMKSRLEEIEKEAEALRQMREAQEREAKAIAAVAAPTTDENEMETEEDAHAADERSVFVGKVDYSASPEEIQAHFQSCGTINRVTILCDKFTGHPKGYAYVEFADPASVEIAQALNESLFKGRLIKVVPKRTNVPGFGRGRGWGRGNYRGGGRGRGYGYSPYRGARGRGRGRGF